MNASFTSDQKNRKIAVLGSTGFIGFALIIRLVEIGFINIHCFYRNEDKKTNMFRDLSTSGITFVQGDVHDNDTVNRLIDGATVVINCSGMAIDWGDRSRIWEVNVDAPKRMIRHLEETGAGTHFIQITSATVFGFSRKEKTEESRLKRSDPFYTASKVDLHGWLRGELQKPRSIPITVLAPSIVWGTGDQIYIPLLVYRMSRGELFYMGRDENLDFVHIDDLVDAILLCLFNEKAYDREYIVTGRRSFNFTPYIDRIAEYGNLEPPTKRIPSKLIYAIAMFMGLSMRIKNLFNKDARPMVTRLAVHLLSKPMRVSSDRIKEELGFNPKVDFESRILEIKEYVEQLASSR